MVYNIKYDLNVLYINDIKVIVPIKELDFKKYINETFHYCSNTFITFNSSHNIKIIQTIIKEIYKDNKIKGSIKYVDKNIIITIFKPGFYCYTDNDVVNDIQKTIQNII